MVVQQDMVESERSLVLRGQVDLPGAPDFVARKLGAVLSLQDAIKQFPQSKNHYVTHHQAPGVYVREWRSTHPDELTIGKRHKRSTINILAHGKVLVVNVADDRDRVIITAPHVWVAPPGSKRVVLTLEPCVWITVHPTELTDISEIERDIIMGDDE